MKEWSINNARSPERLQRASHALRSLCNGCSNTYRNCLVPQPLLHPCRAAVRYEMGDFEGCIKDCDSAVERGRELRADYSLVGRALQRKGNALVKLGRLQEVRQAPLRV